MLKPYRRKLWIGAALIGLLAVYVGLDSKLVIGEDSYAPFGRSIDDIGKAFKLLNLSYFKALDPEEMTTAAIEGMLDELDPYTQFFNRQALEQLQIDTQGKFGGLGITISTWGGESDVPVVRSVIEGTPADTSGLVVGDRIVGIDGEPTAGKSLQEVVDVLRGTPGTGVTITIDRPGRPIPFDQPIIRARIGIRSVLLAEETEPGIGYISMSGPNSRFSENTGRELEKALKSFEARGIRGIILDLRTNPGGLLTQAIAVADKFLEPDRLVVTTRGRSPAQNKEFRTEEASLAGDIPLVVLVNGQSASASEIVAGAIQDSDRGLILGTPTFGKGSVQTVRRIGQQKALKLTTAVYYTPSGRSIHKASKRFLRSRGPVLTVQDTVRLPAFMVVSIIGEANRREDAVAELVDRFDLDQEQAEQVVGMKLDQLLGLGRKARSNGPKAGDPTEEYKTAGGRTVYGGGGITPDVEVEPAKRPRLVVALDRKGLLFDFAVHYAATHPFPSQQPDGFDLDGGVVDSFRAFLADSLNTRGFRYRTLSESRLAELERTLREADICGDAEGEALAGLRRAIEREREAEFEEATPFIRLEIERILANRLWGNGASILASLKGDKQFQEAVRILKTPDLYGEKMNLALVSGKE